MNIMTYEELCDSGEICRYCYRTDFGETSTSFSPNGVFFCEGMWCEESYNIYLDENKNKYEVELI